MKKFFNQFLFYLVLIILLYPASLVKADTTSIEGNNYLEGQESNYINSEEVVQVFNSKQKQLYIVQSDIDLMAKLVYAESRGEPFEGKVAVASVVLNRVINPEFPNSIKEVIFQKNAFSCVKDNEIIANPDEDCYNAVYEAIKGVDPTNNAIFFYNPKISTCSWMKSTEKTDVKTIGNHVFFKN
ncbi:MAG: cell wall hydrolase [Clostridium sp.]|jgi:spore-cortex-lytic enzyme|nr:cell wall hydrolase [Clostridium sp.]